MVSTTVIHVITRDYYSHTDTGGMEGRVGLVGWPIVDNLSKKWSSVNNRSGIGQGKSASQTPPSYALSYACNQSEASWSKLLSFLEHAVSFHPIIHYNRHWQHNSAYPAKRLWIEQGTTLKFFQDYLRAKFYVILWNRHRSHSTTAQTSRRGRRTRQIHCLMGKAQTIHGGLCPPLVPS